MRQLKAVLLLGALACAWNVVAVSGQSQTGTLVGVVVDAVTGRPVPGAIVGVGTAVPAVAGDVAGQPAPSPGGTRQFIATAEGRFVVTGVPPGTVRITATASGYLPGGAGQRRPGGPTRAVVVEAGRHEGPVTIRLWRAASIEGRLVDERGEPRVRAQVRLVRRTWSGGRVTVGPAQSMSTDDRGMFRFSGLAPGDWVVVSPTAVHAVPSSVYDAYRAALGRGGAAAQELQRSMQSSGASPQLIGDRFGEFIVASSNGREGVRPTADGRGLLVQSTVIHPPPDADGLGVITLASGEERSGIELQSVPVRAVSVSGVLLGPDGPAAQVGVRLVPLAFGSGVPEGVLDVARSVTNAQGAFTLHGVLAGEYALRASIVPRAAPQATSTVTMTTGAGTMVTSLVVGGDAGPGVPEEPTWWAEQYVSVSDRDMGGVTLTLAEGPRVSGSADFVGAAPRPQAEDLQRVTVTLRAVDDPAPAPVVARLDAEGRFRTGGHLPGRYLVTASGAGTPWRLQSAMVNGRDVSIEPLVLESSDISGVELTFSDRRTELSGQVLATPGQDTDAVVVAFPSDVPTWVRQGMGVGRTAVARPDSRGRYTMTGLPAGSYLVAALPPELDVQAGDPAFYEMLVPRASAVVLGHGEHRTLDLRAPGLEPAASDWIPDWADDDRTSGPFVPEQQQTPVRDAVVPSVGTGSISGVVTRDDEARTPLRLAVVQITGTAGAVQRTTVTDDDGRFVFRDLPAARYSLTATRGGWLSGSYGQARVGEGSGAPAALDEGQHLTGLRILMAPGAVITGRVVDHVGRPVERASVAVMRFRTVNGERSLVSAGISSLTDDRGDYRVYGLPPGDYVVSASARTTGGDMRLVTDAEVAWAERPVGPEPPQGATVGSAPTFHPGTQDPLSATIVRVERGEERTGIDIVAGVVRTAGVSGRVQLPDGTPPHGLMVNLLGQPAVPGPFLAVGLVVRVTPEGVFTTANVPPGAYTVLARGSDRSSGAGTPTAPLPLWAMQDVQVTGEDIADVHLTLMPGMALSGRLQFDGAPESRPAAVAGYSVRLVPVDTRGASVVPSPSQVAADGTFRVEGLTPGSYRLAVYMPARVGPLPAWTVRHVVHQGRDLDDRVFEVRPGVDMHEVEVVLTDKVTELTGTVRDAEGRPVTDYSVVVLSDDREHWRTGTRRRPAPQRPDTTGRFRLIDLPAGRYHLVLVESPSPDQLADTMFLESLLPSAISVTLAEGERKVQDVRLTGG